MESSEEAQIQNNSKITVENTIDPNLQKRWLIHFSLWVLIVLLGDLLSKSWIFTNYNPETFPSWIILRENKGVAFSMFDQWPEAVAIMTLILVPILIAVYWFQFRREGLLINTAFGMIIGGALGNAWDRIWSVLPDTSIGGVRDFLHVDLGFWPLDPWPTFNIADSGICVGFGLIMIQQVVQSFQAPKEEDHSAKHAQS